MASAQLWLKPEIFFHGVVFAHQKLNFSYLKKVLAYAKTKGSEGGYPYLSWPIWKHMAVNKMLLSEDLAWVYFNLFYTLTEKDRAHWLQLSENQQTSFDNKKNNSYRDKMKVSTLQFVTFLYIQQANKTTLRKSTLGEDWPGVNSRTNHKAKADSSSKISNDSKYLEFVVTHLNQLIEILSDSSLKSEDEKSNKIGMDVVRTLGCFIVGRTEDVDTVQKLQEIAKKDICKCNNGFDKPTKTFLKAHFVSWLTDCLTHNPCDLQACLTSGSKLKWVLPDGSKGNSSSSKRMKVCYSANLGLSSHKNVVFYHVVNKTIAQNSSILSKSHAMFQKCQKSFFYLLSPLKFVSVENCSDCTLVLGPVSTSIKIVDCRNLVIISACRSCMIYRCAELTLHLCTPNQPIIVHDSCTEQTSNVPAVTLAPYNTFYSSLGSHLVEVGLSVSPETNQWNNPLVIDIGSKPEENDAVLKQRRGGAGDGKLYKSPYVLMPPEDFYNFAIPFQPKDKGDNVFDTTEIPWKLPNEYEAAVKAKQTAITKFKKVFRDCNLTKEQRKVFEEMVESRFGQWVADSGNKRQLNALRLKPS